MFKKILIDKSFQNIISFFVIISPLLYTPFAFGAFINDFVRISFFILVIMILFLNLFLNHFIFKLKHLFLFTLLLVYLISSIFVNNSSEIIQTALGYFLILTFSLLLFINVVIDKKLFTKLISKYIIFFKIVTISIIINFFSNLLFPSINILTPYFDKYFKYNYNASPFGLSISKIILNFQLSRNFFFFIEPIFAAPFFLINIFIISPVIKSQRNLFLYLNLTAGLLTSSYLFFLGLFLIFLNKKFPKLIILLIPILITLVSIIPLDLDNSIIASSSSSDRLLRIQIAIDLISSLSYKQLINGIGYSFTKDLEKGISAGLFSSFIEGGLIGLFIPFFLALAYIKNNKSLLIILLLSLMTIEPYKMPFLWFAIILSSLISKYKNIID